MTEIVIESVTNETVIDIDGGPTLVTSVDETEQIIIEEYADPVVIDLNSGPRGEPGAAILTGANPPSGLLGVMGDAYIVTEGSVLVGQVYRKTGPTTWTDVGNVRGPAGGVNSVNAYTGPDVVLTKADLGLSNVENLSIAAKQDRVWGTHAVRDVAEMRVAATSVGATTPYFRINTGLLTTSNIMLEIKISGYNYAPRGYFEGTLLVYLFNTGGGTLHMPEWTNIGDFYPDVTIGKDVDNKFVILLNSANWSHPRIRVDMVTVSTEAHMATILATPWTITNTNAAGVADVTTTAWTAYRNIIEDVDARVALTGTQTVAGPKTFTSLVTAAGVALSSGVYTGSGSGLTALNGSNISTGTVADARLSSNVLLLTTAQTITGVKTFSTAPVVPLNSFAIDKISGLQAALDLKSPLASPTFTGVITGNGSGLTTLNGTNISSGTVADARLSTNVALLSGTQTFANVNTFTKTPVHTPETGVISQNHITAHSLRMWHDRFRFTTPTFQTSADGTTWVAGSSTYANALDGRGDTGLFIDHAARYARFTWDNTNDMAFANITRLVTRWGYVATTPNVTVTAESSADGTTWTSRGTSTITGAVSVQHTLAMSEHGGDTYYRVTFQVVGGGASGAVAQLHNLEVQTYRTGSQGKGFEIEFPYWWSGTREVGFYNQIRPMSSGVYDLGTTAMRWKDAWINGTATITSIAATNLRVGTSTTARNSLIADASGNATWGLPTLLSATKTETDNGSTYAQGIYTQSTSDGTWPALNGVVMTVFHGTERAMQIAGGKNENRLRWRAAEVASTNGWKAWNIVADDAMVVHLAGAESITGVKTFTVSPIVPAPTTDLQASTKKYVDDGLALKAPLASPTFTGTVSGITATMVGLSNITNTVKVDLTTAQSIGGVKTFTSSPVVPDSSWTIAKTTGLQSALDAKAPLASPTFTGTITGNGSGLTALNGSSISTGTVDVARLGPAVVRVVHGSTAGTARPAATHVEWVGSVTPTNAIANDTWVNTA